MQNPRAVVRGRIFSATLPPRLEEKSFLVASLEPDEPKNPGPARQTRKPDFKDASNALQPHTTFVRPLNDPHSTHVRVAYGSCTAFQAPKKGLIRVNTGKYDPTGKTGPLWLDSSVLLVLEQSESKSSNLAQPTSHGHGPGRMSQFSLFEPVCACWSLKHAFSAGSTPARASHEQVIETKRFFIIFTLLTLKTSPVTPAVQVEIHVIQRETNKMKTSLLMLGLGLLTASMTVQAQPDYAPAIWRPAYPGHWYTSGNGHHFLVIHDMEGYYLSTISYFQQSGTQASINYCVNGLKDNSSDSPAGEISQMVREFNYAWHAICWNTWMAGTEHEGFVSNPAWYTEAMYQASSGLQRHMASGYGIPIDRNHIVGHNEWQNPAWTSWMASNWPQIDTTCNNHTDPGQYWDWTHFMALIGGTTDPHVNPTLGINSDGREEIFIVGKSGALLHSYQNTINGSWSSWISLGGSYAQNSQPKILRNKDGRLEVFAIASNGQLNHASQGTAGNSGSWSAFSVFSSSLTPTVKVGGGTNANGTLDVFVIGTDSALYEMHQTTPGGSWSSWTNMGGIWSQDDCIANGNDLDGRQEVLLISSTGAVNTFFQTAVNGGWSAATSLGGSFAQSARTALARNSDGRLEAFVIGSGGALYHASQTGPNSSWTGWTSLGGTWESDAQPIAGAEKNGVLEVMVVGGNGNFYHNYQTGGGWSGWLNIGGSFLQNVRPVLGINQDGRLEAFMTGSAGDLQRNAETSANSSTWASWTSIGGSWN
jgi:hypothetical protein